MAGPFAPFAPTEADLAAEALRALLAADADLAAWANQGRNIVRRIFPIPSLEGVAGGSIWVSIDARSLVYAPCAELSIPLLIGIQWLGMQDVLQPAEASVDAIAKRCIEIVYDDANSTLGGNVSRVAEVRTISYDTQDTGRGAVYYLGIGVEYRIAANAKWEPNP